MKPKVETDYTVNTTKTRLKCVVFLGCMWTNSICVQYVLLHVKLHFTQGIDIITWNGKHDHEKEITILTCEWIFKIKIKINRYQITHFLKYHMFLPLVVSINTGSIQYLLMFWCIHLCELCCDLNIFEINWTWFVLLTTLKNDIQQN